MTTLPKSTHNLITGSLRRQASSRPSILPDRPLERSLSSIEIQKFAEDDEEDFSDILGPDRVFQEKEESEKSSEDGNLMVLSRISHSSWVAEDEEEEDPFASMDPGWDDVDLQANIARDRHARLAEKVEQLVRSMKMTEGEDKLQFLSEDLLALLWENAEVKELIISAHGLLPILEVLEPCSVKSRQPMILQLLKVVNTIILDDVELQENLCFVGGIPIITKFAARQFSIEIRLEAAAFVRQMYQTSTLTLQMFVSAGGLNVLVEFLDEDYDSARDLVLIGVNGIWNVFELQGPTPKNDFCRIFSRSKILDPLALVLLRVLDEDAEDEEDELTELIEGRIVNIFYLFSQAENYVKEMVAERQVLKGMFNARTGHATYDIDVCGSRTQGTSAHDAGSPDHNAQVHQELVYAVHNTGSSARGGRHRLPDRVTKHQLEERAPILPRDIKPGPQHNVQPLPPEQRPPGIRRSQRHHPTPHENYEDRQAAKGICVTYHLRHGTFWKQRSQVLVAK